MPISARCAIELISCTIVKNGQDARSTKNEFSCGTGILPVPKKVIENGARCEIEPIIAKGRSSLQSSSATSKAMP
jgi:hypothetical protein